MESSPHTLHGGGLGHDCAESCRLAALGSFLSTCTISEDLFLQRKKSLGTSSFSISINGTKVRGLYRSFVSGKKLVQKSRLLLLRIGVKCSVLAEHAGILLFEPLG